jgi:hypothetical protein
LYDFCKNVLADNFACHGRLRLIEIPEYAVLSTYVYGRRDGNPVSVLYVPAVRYDPFSFNAPNPPEFTVDVIKNSFPSMMFAGPVRFERGGILFVTLGTIAIFCLNETNG